MLETIILIARAPVWRLLTLLLLIVAGQCAIARTIFVAPQGDDDASGTREAPLATVQAGIDLAVAGDTVLIAAGQYNEALRTRSPGTPAAPITLLGEKRGEVLVTNSADNLLVVAHPFIYIKNLIFDGQFAKHDLIRVLPNGDSLVFENNLVINGAKDGIDLGNAATVVPPEFDYLNNVVITNSEIRHFLGLDLGGNRIDAHGIVAGGVRNLQISHTTVFMVSGDALQLADGNWDNVLVDNVQFRNARIDEHLARASGFDVGINPGENAIDTKQDASLPVRGRLHIRQSRFSGWQGDLITNSAALNLKEKVSVVVDACELYDNEIAMRLRGSGGSDVGAHIIARNNVLFDNQRALRIEDELRESRLINNTFAGPGGFQTVSGGAAGDFFAVNNLVLAAEVPKLLPQAFNLAVDDSSFVNSVSRNFQLVGDSPAIDNAMTLIEVSTDRLGVTRPQGAGYDFGAFEYQLSPVSLPISISVLVAGISVFVLSAMSQLATQSR